MVWLYLANSVNGMESALVLALQSALDVALCFLEIDAIGNAVERQRAGGVSIDMRIEHFSDFVLVEAVVLEKNLHHVPNVAVFGSLSHGSFSGKLTVPVEQTNIVMSIQLMLQHDLFSGKGVDFLLDFSGGAKSVLHDLVFLLKGSNIARPLCYIR